MNAWQTILLGVVIVVIALAGPGMGPATSQTSSVSISDVAHPNSAAQGSSFDLSVTVSATEMDDVEAAVTPPTGITCTPSGAQTVAISGGEGTVSFECTGESSGDYRGEISIDVTGTSNDGESLSASDQTGLRVLSPAALTLSASLSNDTTTTGTSRTLTAIIQNTGDVELGYEASITTGSEVSDTHTAGQTSAKLTEDAIETVKYSVSSDTTGTYDITVDVTGENDQNLSETLQLTVNKSDTGGGSDDGGGSSSTTEDEEVEEETEEDQTTESTEETSGPSVANTSETVKDIVPETVELPEDVNATRAEVANLTPDQETNRSSVSFSNESATEAIDFSDNTTGSVSVVEFDSEPEKTGKAPGQAVSVTQITVPAQAREKSATIRHRVSQDRLEAIGAEPENLLINRFNEDAEEWQALETEVLEVTNTTVRLESETPGFSYFAVTAVSEPIAVLDAPTEVETGEEVVFDASGSTSEDAEIVDYHWTIDGEAVDGNEMFYDTFTQERTAVVSVTVEVEGGKTNSTSHEIIVHQKEDEEDYTTEESTTVKETTTEMVMTTDTTDQTETASETPGFGIGLGIVAVLAIGPLLRSRREE